MLDTLIFHFLSYCWFYISHSNKSWATIFLRDILHERIVCQNEGLKIETLNSALYRLYH